MSDPYAPTELPDPDPRDRRPRTEIKTLRHATVDAVLAAIREDGLLVTNLHNLGPDNWRAEVHWPVAPAHRLLPRSSGYQYGKTALEALDGAHVAALAMPRPAPPKPIELDDLLA